MKVQSKQCYSFKHMEDLLSNRRNSRSPFCSEGSTKTAGGTRTRSGLTADKM